MNRRSALFGGIGTALGVSKEPGQIRAGKHLPNGKTPNVVFILTDDHRHDALGFLRGQTFLRTPNLDTLACDGAHFKNAFVTTSLCSPSRATILTGQYAHRHRIVDNNTAIPPGTVFFPQYLQKAGYQTAFIGKWHMGNVAAPQPGFDHWVSLFGQGSYLPPRQLNVNGNRVTQKGYITDELTDYAVTWLEHRDKSRPFFLYLSHKAVHGPFTPAERHKGVYADANFVPPATMAAEGQLARHRPMWVQNQRNSWHGVENHGDLSIAEQYKLYAETLLGVDESVGRLLDLLKRQGDLDSTLIVYMGDNGYAFGEHGLVDKRTAYEESMRVPMLARCPELFSGGRVVEQTVANLDIMPTVLAAAGVEPPGGLDGMNWLPLAQGQQVPWRDTLLYEYYWERNFPMTPTMHALRGNRYKYIHYYGIWDIDELYDIQEDPRETNNLIFSPQHAPLVAEMNRKLFEVLADTGGLSIPLYPDRGRQSNLRNGKKSRVADFPPELVRQP